MDVTITSTTTPGQIKPENNCKGSVFHIPPNPGLELPYHMQFKVIPTKLNGLNN